MDRVRGSLKSTRNQDAGSKAKERQMGATPLPCYALPGPHFTRPGVPRGLLPTPYISFLACEAGLRLGWELQGLRERAQQLWDRPHS